jgi:hypothetical protein
MCIFGGGSSAAPPPLPPAPPAPLPPETPLPPPDPVTTEINPKVLKAKQDKGSKKMGEYGKGTGSLRIKLNKLKPKTNTGQLGAKSGGVN